MPKTVQFARLGIIWIGIYTVCHAVKAVNIVITMTVVWCATTATCSPRPTAPAYHAQSTTVKIVIAIPAHASSALLDTLYKLFLNNNILLLLYNKLPLRYVTVVGDKTSLAAVNVNLPQSVFRALRVINWILTVFVRTHRQRYGRWLWLCVYCHWVCLLLYVLIKYYSIVVKVRRLVRGRSVSGIVSKKKRSDPENYQRLE